MGDPGRQPWWNVPDYFHSPLVFYMDEDQEDFIFGPDDEYLRTLEVHTNTLIQLERWITPTDQTQVTVVGPFTARLWVMNLIRKLGSENSVHQTEGKMMLLHIRRYPLTEQDLQIYLVSESGLVPTE
ncbi:KH homology domain-containing protein 1B-like [Apodemus sylvaticus]|uniref:KH homology domain-containing protein 1B-like n=1 Tax=Apodemus sylvaticus TaxID=10129 RepID=UPI002242DBFF|nr:KH homology domain-containing protein 1B-like [Apodemus sylvaticus]